MPTNLNNFRTNVTSQNGEDGVLREIFTRIGTNNQWCCEFGAWDGKNFSNTYDLWHNQSWSAVLMEIDPVRFTYLLENVRDRDVIPYNVAVGLNDLSLDSILSWTDAPKDLDLLSIDIDNDDYLIWEGLHNYRPRVVVIEVNSDYPETKDMIPGKEGASIKSMVELATKKKYELAVHIGNAIFVAEEEFQKLGIVGPWQDRFDRSWVKYE